MKTLIRSASFPGQTQKTVKMSAFRSTNNFVTLETGAKWYENCLGKLLENLRIAEFRRNANN